MLSNQIDDRPHKNDCQCFLSDKKKVAVSCSLKDKNSVISIQSDKRDSSYETNIKSGVVFKKPIEKSSFPEHTKTEAGMVCGKNDREKGVGSRGSGWKPEFVFCYL